MSRPVNKLFDLEIDEVSVVDRPANQHGLISFAKNDSDEDGATEEMFFNHDGELVDTESLQIGDLVYDVDGAEYVFTDETEDSAERELESVGKSGLFAALKGGWSSGASGAKLPSIATAGMAGPRKAAVQTGNAARRATKTKQFKVGAPIAAGSALAGGAGYAMAKSDESTPKSFGDEILEQLSKAITDTDRDEIVAKAMDEVAKSQARIEDLEKALNEEHDARVTAEFVELAKSYNLPVSPVVLGPILKSIAEVLSEEELDILENLFNAVGDALYSEVGYVGDTDNASVLGQVDEIADELVGKSNGQFSKAQAMVDLFEVNPDAYDAYLIEGR